MFPASYFSPSYFTSAYFAGGSASYRDRDAFAAIVAALSSTREFAEVAFALAADAASLPAGRAPTAVVLPGDWSESDDLGSNGLVRRVRYSLTLAVRGNDPSERFRRLDRLTAAAQNTIEGSDLGGRCLRRLTRLRLGRFDSKSRHPEQRAVLDGEFSYLIPTTASHDTSA